MDESLNFWMDGFVLLEKWWPVNMAHPNELGILPSLALLV